MQKSDVFYAAGSVMALGVGLLSFFPRIAISLIGCSVVLGILAIFKQNPIVKRPVIRASEWHNRVDEEVSKWGYEYLHQNKHNLKSLAYLDQIGNSGFQLLNDGDEFAYDVNLEDFEIKPSIVATAKMVPHVSNVDSENAFMQVWIKNTAVIDESRWNLPLAFAKGIKLSKILRFTYRDSGSNWYSTTQKITWSPSKKVFEFGPPTQKKIKPSQAVA